jgi:hypothetical protein
LRTRADAIFEGRVLAVVDEGSARRVIFEVVQAWGGIETERAEVLVGSGECAPPFEADTSWLVFAQRQGHVLATDLCEGTRRIEDAGEVLAILGAGVVPVELTEDDEVEAPATVTTVRRAGCASCAIGASSGAPRTGLVALVVGLAVLAGPRARRRARAQLL